MIDPTKQSSRRAVVDLDSLKRRIAERAARSALDVADVADRITDRITAQPGALCAVLDCSGSMSGDNKLANAKVGLMDMARTVAREPMEVGLVSFSSLARLEVPIGPFGSAFVSKVEQLEVDGSTNMAGGLATALEALGARKSRRVILLVTDGCPDDRNAALKVGRRAKDAGIEIWTIGTPDADQDFLRLIAWKGAASAVTAPEQLAQAIARSTALLLGHR